MIESGSCAAESRRRGLGRARARSFIAIAALLLSLGLAACGDSNEKAEGGTGPDAPASVLQDAASPGTDTSAVAGLDGLDAETIVAAQEQVLIDIYQAVLPSVVQIEISRRVQPGQQSPDRGRLPPDDLLRFGEGSGFVWSKDGYIVTNQHIVSGADRVSVIFSDRTRVQAEVVAADPHSDLAVLRVDLPEDRLHPVTIGNSDELKVGQMTLAIGNPFGQEFTMTRGIVSAVGRVIRSPVGGFSIPQVIQTDAPINPGNSGGPLLDRRGQVIGVVSQIRSQNGVSAGVGFAVPVNIASRVVPELISKGEYKYAYLGIGGHTLTPNVARAMGLLEDTHGALITQVFGGTPADRAGLVGSTETRLVDGIGYPVGGDVITGVDGIAIDGIADLIAHLVHNNRPGDEVTLDLVRGRGRTDQVTLVLAARPDDDATSSLFQP